ncbi:uncharacterized protein LOC134856811 [Symsagittifera roscoffensis]|uniref:uncharacterized protein LOC134856811 n=1 Tax=Symsagittifera roscoffensis TaxID=84072 RepID=UPI00307BDB72
MKKIVQTNAVCRQKTSEIEKKTEDLYFSSSEDEEETRSHSVEDWTKIGEAIKACFSKVKEKNLEKDDLSEPLMSLNQMHDSLDSFQVDFWKLANELELVGLFSNSLNCLKNDFFAEPAFFNYEQLSGLISSGSERSGDIRKKLIDSGAYKLIIWSLEHPDIKNGLLSDDACDERLRWKMVVALDSLFTVIYNILRYYSESQRIMRKTGLVQTCLLYLKSKIPSIKACALLVLTFAADLDESNEIIQATQCNIKFVIRNLLEEAMRSETRRNSSGYTVEELLESLSRLAKNFNNAIEMLNLGIVDDCFKILDETRDHLEVKWSLHLIWSLSFLDTCREKLKSHKIVNIIQKASQSKNTEISSAAKGILWGLGKTEKENLSKNNAQKQRLPITQTQPKALHIMISYCWNQQKTALKLFEGLKKSGKEVWIDVEKMEGDSLEKMAEAVDNSEIVICCFSEDYSNSQSCRAEATYAYKQKKKIVFAKVQPEFEPRGWLGLILGAEIYYQLHNEIDFSVNFANLINYINKTKSVTESVDEIDFIVSENKQNNLNSTPSSASINITKFMQWTTDEVKEWLASMGFQKSHLKESELGTFTGQNLKEMKTWQATAPQFFLEFCQKNLKIKGTKLLVEFSAALREL